MATSLGWAGLVLVLAVAGCGVPQFNSTFAPTGAKGIVDEFGRTIYLDEECGQPDTAGYEHYFQNALFRDGAVARGKLWLVDGSHLWSAIPAADADTDVTLNIERPYLGHGNGIAGTDAYMAVALVERGVVVYPDYNFDDPVYLPDVDRALDVDIQENWLAVAAGDQGVLLFDMSRPADPLLMETFSTGGYASGVRWGVGKNEGTLYFSACRRAGYIDMNAKSPVPVLTPALSHANAKDAHGNGNRMAVANNGGGVWFYDMESMRRDSIYELQDPNFYANAAYVIDNYAYVAAGNRELIALLMNENYAPEPKASLRKDPLGVTVSEGVVYGFGNFRDIGERTVVRTKELDDSPSAYWHFANGYPSWIEQRRYALWFTDAAGNQWLDRLEGADYAVYKAAPDATSWTLQTEYRFYATVGTYAVAVSADNQVRVTPNGITESTIVGDWPDPFPARGYVEIVNGKIMIRDRLLVQKFYQQYDFFRYAYESNEQNLDRRTSNIESDDYFACRPSQTGVDLGKNANTGTYVHNEEGGIWCSRQVDQYVPENRPSRDRGTYVIQCHNRSCSKTPIQESGLIGVSEIHAKMWVGLIDDRAAFTTSLVVWEPQPKRKVPLEKHVGFTFLAHPSNQDEEYWVKEVSRYVRFGRPESWLRLNDSRFRVWMTDGSAFTYAPLDNKVSDVMAPLDSPLTAGGQP